MTGRAGNHGLREGKGWESWIPLHDHHQFGSGDPCCWSCVSRRLRCHWLVRCSTTSTSTARKNRGEATIAVILAEFGSIERFTNAKALAAYVGVAPRLRQSGQWKGRTMLSKTGRSQLRKAFFMPALVALRDNPVFVELKKRITAAGKAKMAIVGAAMRKLIHVIYGVLKTKTPFDPKIAAPGLDL